jgi:hypothetical protein
VTRAQWIIIVIALVMTGGLAAVYMAMEDAQDRPSVQRRTAQVLLEDHARVLKAYRDAHQGKWPSNVIDLRGFSKKLGDDQRLRFNANHVPGTDVFYRYRPPTDGGTAHIVMASDKPNRAVAAGEEFGAKGETAGAAVAETWYVLDAGLNVLELNRAQHRARAGWVFSNSDSEARQQGAGDNDSEWGAWQ